jgi:membrane-bound lytic murein transglycosylase B
LGAFAAARADQNSYDVSAIAKLSRDASFDQFIADFWPKARATGITRKTYRAATAGLTPNSKIIALGESQPEFNTAIWDYVAKRVTHDRISDGRTKRSEHARTLKAIERRYGVDRHVLLAIWGMETNYGGYKGELGTIRSLATMAFTGRRQKYGRQQLLAALKILQNGDITPQAMTGSWAGAMGHTQFIPTTYDAYAVDWTGDGKRDVWNSISDALASTANYMTRSGWKSDRPWGWEVKLPRSFNYALIGRKKARSVASWVKQGLKPARGGRFGSAGAKSWVILPAGADGPAFLVTDNFRAILRYNASTAYALAVGHLADRIRGAEPLVAQWPIHHRPLSRSQRIELQGLLAERGFYDGDVSGRVGRQTVAAIVAYQKMAGLPPDGFASVSLLESLRRSN